MDSAIQPEILATESALELVFVRAVRSSAEEAIAEVLARSYCALKVDLKHLDHTRGSWKELILLGLQQTVDHARWCEADVLSELEEAMKEAAYFGFSTQKLLQTPT